MIRMNLLGEEVRKDSSGALWIGGFVLSIVVYAVVCLLLYSDITSTQVALEEEVEGLDRQLQQIRKTTKEVRDLEAKRAELNEKLAIIANLKQSKLGPVRVLDDLAQATPERAWIVDFREKGSVLQLTGFALDLPTISTFTRQLEDSAFFYDVDLVEAKQVIREGAKIQSFVLQAKLSYSGVAPDEEPAAEVPS